VNTVDIEMERNRGLRTRYRNLGDDVIFVSNILCKYPDSKINLYFWKRAVTDLFLELAYLLDTEQRITLIEDEAPPSALKLGRLVDHTNFKRYAKLNENRLKPDLDQIKKIKNNLDFSRVICWNRRVWVEGASPAYAYKTINEVPQQFFKKYPDYQFVNIGTPVGETDRRSHMYDLHTTIWLLKNCAIYLGSDSGATHLALTVKKPEDVYIWAKNDIENERGWGMDIWEKEGTNIFY
tara:strand:+ start:234 stop:944 length:711 start_codon:yes stop_codon:yes gene_type:complete